MKFGGARCICMNAWYVAGWSSEMTAKPIGRTLLDEPVVMYRGKDGKLVALEDRCCHRGMPLSHGEVFDNNIRCEYHGTDVRGIRPLRRDPGTRHHSAKRQGSQLPDRGARRPGLDLDGRSGKRGS